MGANPIVEEPLMVVTLEVDTALPKITIAPINAAANSKGSIHDDEKAREMGFRGGFVGGSTILAYMGRLMHDNFGRAWVETGTLNGRLRRPVYEGGDVTVEGTIIEVPSDANGGRVTVELRVVTDEGEIGAIGSATCIPA